MKPRVLPAGLVFQYHLADSGLVTARSMSTTSLVRQLGAWRGDDAVPAYRKLADGVRTLVLDGRVPLEVRLPGERDLATALGISRTTVGAAFGLLREEGYLDSRRGSGSRTRVPAGPGDRSGGPLAGPDDPGVLDLASASLPASSVLHSAYATALAALPAHLPGHGYSPVGLPELRAVIAQRHTRRGLPTTPEQVLVTTGAQHALALVLRLLTAPGDRVVLDHPTYPHAIDAVQRSSCRAVPVGLTATGWDVDGVVAALHQTSPRLAYLVPDFHNPTGHSLAPDDRAALVSAAQRARTVLVVDETLTDLGLDRPAPPSVATHDRRGTTVITLGSVGKSFWGGLRVGWIRADARTIDALAGVRASLDLGTPVLEQLAVAVLLADDEAALTERRDLLRAQRDHLLHLVAEHLPSWTVRVPAGGVSLWAELTSPLSSALAATAPRHGVRITAGPRFGVDGAFERFVRLPFTRPVDELTPAIQRLAAAWAACTPVRDDRTQDTSSHSQP